MTKDEIKSALENAIREHQLNNEAVQATSIPAGLEGIVAGALASALTAKLVRIFDHKA